MKEKENRFFSLRDEYDSNIDRLTIEQLAKEFNVHRTTISRLENDSLKNEYPKVHILKEYRKKFNVTYEYLLEESDAKSLDNIDFGRDLGLSDEAIGTLKKLKEYPDTMNLVNQFLGQGEHTLLFFQNLFEKFYQEFNQEEQLAELEKDSDEYEDFKSSLEIFKNVGFDNLWRNSYYSLVATKLKAIFKRHKRYEDLYAYDDINDIDDTVYEQILEDQAKLK